MFADQNLGLVRAVVLQPSPVRAVVLQPSPVRAVDQGQFVFVRVNSVPVLLVFTVLI